MEDHGVGDDGAGHAAGLRDVVHSQQSGYGCRDAGAGFVNSPQDVGSVLNALIEERGGLVDGVLGNGNEAGEVGEVGDGAVEPAGLGEADGLVAFSGEDAVAESGIGDSSGEVVGIANGLRVAEGDGGLDGAGLADDSQVEAVTCLGLDVLGRVVLGLDDYGRAARGGDKDVGVVAGVALDDLGVFGAHGGFAQHSLEYVAEGGVGAGFGLVGHLRFLLRVRVRRWRVRGRGFRACLRSRWGRGVRGGCRWGRRSRARDR